MEFFGTDTRDFFILARVVSSSKGFLIWFLPRFILYFQELLLAEEWAKKNNVKFPPIDAEEQFKKYGMKELYVFRHPTDPSCPIVMHFVIVNLRFREESAPGENLL